MELSIINQTRLVWDCQDGLPSGDPARGGPDWGALAGVAGQRTGSPRQVGSGVYVLIWSHGKRSLVTSNWVQHPTPSDLVHLPVL